MACSVCPLPVLGNLGDPGPGGVPPGLWNGKVTYRVRPKSKRSALPHFKAVLSFLCFVYFLKAHKEDWIFNCSLEGILSFLFPLSPPAFPSCFSFTILLGLGWMPDTVNLPLETANCPDLRLQPASPGRERRFCSLPESLATPLCGNRGGSVSNLSCTH